MIKLYRKNPLFFALVWIAAYVFLISVTDTLSAHLGVRQVLTLPTLLIMALILLNFVRKDGLWRFFGLCGNRGVPYARYLYLVPFAVIVSSNLWNGVQMNDTLHETILVVFSMLLVGFVEEVLFRGFLFQAMAARNLKAAVVVSSLTFGLGHIVNLLTHANLLDTVLQICYATSIGFLFTIFLVKSGSLWPCVAVHGILNALNAFAVPGDEACQIAQALVLTAIALGYAAYILFRVPARQK